MKFWVKEKRSTYSTWKSWTDNFVSGGNHFHKKNMHEHPLSRVITHSRVTTSQEQHNLYSIFSSQKTKTKKERLYSTFDNSFPSRVWAPYFTRSLEHRHKLTRIDNLMMNLSRHGHNTTATPRCAFWLIFLRWPVTSQGHVRESLERSPVRAA